MREKVIIHLIYQHEKYLNFDNNINKFSNNFSEKQEKLHEIIDSDFNLNKIIPENYKIINDDKNESK